MFIADQAGNVFVMNCLPTAPEMVIRLETEKNVCIRGLARSMNNAGYFLAQNKRIVKANYLLTTDTEGFITVFDINVPGKEHLAKRVGSV